MALTTRRTIVAITICMIHEGLIDLTWEEYCVVELAHVGHQVSECFMEVAARSSYCIL